MDSQAARFARLRAVVASGPASGKPKPVFISDKLGKQKTKPSAQKIAADQKTLEHWVLEHRVTDDDVFDAETIWSIDLPDVRYIPGNDQEVDLPMPDLAARLQLSGTRIRIHLRFPEGVFGKAWDTEAFGTLSTHIPLREILALSRVGLEEVAARTGITEETIILGLNSQMRLKRLELIMPALGIEMRYIVERPYALRNATTRLKFIEQQIPEASKYDPCGWPGLDLANRLNDPAYLFSRALAPACFGVDEAPEPRLMIADAPIFAELNAALAKFGIRISIAILDHAVGWLTTYGPVNTESLRALIEMGPDLATRDFGPIVDPAALSIKDLNAALDVIGVRHRYVIRYADGTKPVAFDMAALPNAAQLLQILEPRRSYAPPIVIQTTPADRRPALPARSPTIVRQPRSAPETGVTLLPPPTAHAHQKSERTDDPLGLAQPRTEVSYPEEVAKVAADVARPLSTADRDDHKAPAGENFAAEIANMSAEELIDLHCRILEKIASKTQEEHRSGARAEPVRASSISDRTGAALRNKAHDATKSTPYRIACISFSEVLMRALPRDEWGTISYPRGSRESIREFNRRFSGHSISYLIDFAAHKAKPALRLEMKELDLAEVYRLSKRVTPARLAKIGSFRAMRKNSLERFAEVILQLGGKLSFILRGDGLPEVIFDKFRLPMTVLQASSKGVGTTDPSRRDILVLSKGLHIAEHIGPEYEAAFGEAAATSDLDDVEAVAAGLLASGYRLSLWFRTRNGDEFEIRHEDAEDALRLELQTPKADMSAGLDATLLEIRWRAIPIDGWRKTISFDRIKE